MGGLQTKADSGNVEIRILREKSQLLQQKMHEIMCLRQTESQAYEQETVVHALKEAEWKRERKWLRWEVKRLKNRLEERDQRKNRGMESEKAGKKSERACEVNTGDLVLKQMREERAQRDEAVEKWKRLYLAIKIELDNLIKRTHQGETACWRDKGEYQMDELQRELKAKEETIELLQAHIASMEQEESRRESEIDILRQSLRIMSQKKQQKSIIHELFQVQQNLSRTYKFITKMNEPLADPSFVKQPDYCYL